MTGARYDAVADFYEAGWTDAYEDPVSEAFFELLGKVADLRVLDIACGHGRITRELARRGADVVGVDLSAALLGKARADEERKPLGIQYVQADAASDSLLEGEIFDTVVCSFGLSDIDDLDGCISTVARLLRPGGYFVFSLLHPCFPGGGEVSGSWPSTETYYDEGWWAAHGRSSSLRRQVGANHRMVSTYLNILAVHRLYVDVVVEPTPPREWSEQRLAVACLPVFLVVRCVNRLVAEAQPSTSE